MEQALLPGTMYEHVSGGDPPIITELTLDQLRAFHRKHYHPSNSRIITYGDLDVLENLEFLSERLKGYEKMDKLFIKDSLKLFDAPKRIEVEGPLDTMSDAEKQNKIIVSLLTNKAMDVQESFHMSILSFLLTNGPASPFYKALIDSNIGSDYSSGTGYNNSAFYSFFSVGLQGVSEADLLVVEREIEAVLQNALKTPFPQSRIDAVVHLLELSQKHKTANFGLSMIQSLAGSWMRGADPFRVLKIDDRIAEFKRRLKEGNLFENLIQKYLLNNAHKLVFIMKPSASFNEKLGKKEQEILLNAMELKGSKEKFYEKGVELLKKQEEKEGKRQ